MTALLKLADVSKRFDGLVAVNQMKFDIKKGEIVGLLGPNGSGKTTLINLISGALSPSQGSICINGKNIAGKRADQIARAGVARTFQLVRILPSMTVLENARVPAAFGAKAHRGSEIDRIALTHLKKVGLGDKADMMPGELTYIDQKRLELARALAAEPEVLLLDEWLAGLNPSELQDGIALIKELQSTGLTILLVEHIMEAVRALCPRCVVMNAGTLIADGPTNEVLANPDVVAAYLGDEYDA
ncbi:Glutamine transport ATP-binding protein GlnQ [Roseibium album]|nr:Glutamine transport ATP-binding protein GlnQ [Roseibium album]